MSHEAKPILCYVTDRKAFSGTPDQQLAQVSRVIGSVVAAGVDWIQIREKDLPARRLAEFTREVSAARRAQAATKIIVNDRLDVAVAGEADGVHLGEESIPVEVVAAWRREGNAPAEFLIGASCHSLEAARVAARDRADYLFFGPVFATPAKLKFGPPQGIERLAEVCRAVRIPVLAIGGITTENAAECLRAGAAGLAAIRLFQDSNDLSETMAGLQRAGLP